MACGSLYIVATPIGNLDDITVRAVDTLRAVDIIACEDTRRTSILTSKYGISKPLVSFYSHNQLSRTGQLLKSLEAGKNVALVSDAGTPGISDPGYVIIKAAISGNIPVIPVPGPSALISALIVSGKPTHKFVFEGFLSNKQSQRRKRLRELKDDERTIILYESPHRIVKLLEDIVHEMGDREIVCVRELTKKFEEIKREKAADIAAFYQKNTAKGEFVVIL